MVDGNGRRFCLDVEHRGIPELRTHLPTARRLVRRGSAPPAVAVAAEGTAQACEEGEEERDEGGAGEGEVDLGAPPARGGRRGEGGVEGGALAVGGGDGHGGWEIVKIGELSSSTRIRVPRGRLS